MNLEQLFRKQAIRCKAAIKKFEEGKEILKKAKADNLTEDAQTLINKTEALVEAIESRLPQHPPT